MPKINCEKHGELECRGPDRHGHLHCPRCMCEAVAKLFGMDINEGMATDDLGYPLLYRPYIPLQVTKLNVSMSTKEKKPCT